MILLEVTYQAGDKRDEFVKAILENNIPERTRAEKGCEQYKFACPIEHPDQLVLVEHWADEDALVGHQAGETVQKLKAIKESLGIDTVIAKYEV